MRPLLPFVLALALASPLIAQEGGSKGDADGETEEGFDLMQEGARLLFRGLMSEMEPALNDFRGLAEDMSREFGPAMQLFAEEMGEGMAELMARLDDIRNYEAPVILDNGDILIRRRPDAPPYVAPDPEDDEPAEEIDL